MMNRRKFMRWLGFAPAAAVVAVALPRDVWFGEGQICGPKYLTFVDWYPQPPREIRMEDFRRARAELADNLMDRRTSWRWRV